MMRGGLGLRVAGGPGSQWGIITIWKCATLLYSGHMLYGVQAIECVCELWLFDGEGILEGAGDLVSRL